MPDVTGYHAHIYFDANDSALAEDVCKQAHEKFGATVGRMHDRPVGPHPRGNYQLSFGTDVFGKVVPWMILNRAGLTVFVHANTGEDLKDHTEHVMWLGPSELLNLSIFKT